MVSLSLQNRKALASVVEQTAFDVLIIGGGITGAGIALDAASRGLSVCLIEKYDFASGTSSKSTKLIHGGLRYLINMEFALVREVGSERSILHALAKHLVQPVTMLLPIYKNGTLGKFTTAIALGVYDWLAKVKQEERFVMLKKHELLQREPLLNAKNLIGGAAYKEYRTDDARLTISILKKAASFGAYCFNYCKFQEPIYAEGKISGAVVTDLLSNTKHNITAQYVVNAAGPWVDEIRSTDNSLKGKYLHHTKGVHIVVSATDFPLQQAIYFDVESDRRMVFAIPREEIVYIGTTDTNYSADLNFPGVESADVQYLLDAVNSKFDTVNLSISNIQSVWSGLRPLIHEDGKAPGELSRKDEIFISDTNLISIAGGKLTGYRKMSQKVVDLIARQISQQSGERIDESGTHKITLYGANFTEELDTYIEKRAGEAKQIGYTYAQVKALVLRYGTDAENIIENAFNLYTEYPDTSERLLAAELLYAVNNEMITNISDFLIRRTGMLYFQLPEAKKIYHNTARILGDLAGYTAEEVQLQTRFFEQSMSDTQNFN